MPERRFEERELMDDEADLSHQGQAERERERPETSGPQRLCAAPRPTARVGARRGLPRGLVRVADDEGRQGQRDEEQRAREQAAMSAQASTTDQPPESESTTRLSRARQPAPLLH
jgi:hypothetical protein